MKNILGGVKNKIKQHYEKSGLLEHSSVKIKNPWKIKLFIFCMLALPIAQFLVFTVYINIDGILMTFQNVDFSTNEEKFVGFGNFAKFFRNFTAVNRDNFIKSILEFVRLLARHVSDRHSLAVAFGVHSV